MIKNYLYLFNVEVSRHINFDFYRQVTDRLLTVGRHVTNYGNYGKNCPPTVGGGELFFTITSLSIGKAVSVKDTPLFSILL